jgi:hypothetical protein
MSRARRVLWCSLTLLSCLAISRPLSAQVKAKTKQYVVTTDRAITITRTVLADKGYQVVRVDRVGATRVVYYRRGSMGRGHGSSHGKGPIQRMVIRTVRDRVVFEDTEPSVLVDIDLKLKL